PAPVSQALQWRPQPRSTATPRLAPSRGTRRPQSSPEPLVLQAASRPSTARRLPASFVRSTRASALHSPLRGGFVMSWPVFCFMTAGDTFHLRRWICFPFAVWPIWPHWPHWPPPPPPPPWLDKFGPLPDPLDRIPGLSRETFGNVQTLASIHVLAQLLPAE